MIGLALMLVVTLVGRPDSGASADPTVEGRRLSEWVQDLKLSDVVVRFHAKMVLRAAGEQAIPHLVPLIRAKDSELRVRALMALDAICCDKTFVLPEIRPLLEDPDPSVRVSAAASISLIEGTAKPDVLAALVSALESDDGFISWRAASALRDLGPKGGAATDALARALRHKNADTRLMAALALGAIGPAASAAIPALEEALAGADEGLKQNARFALRAIRGE
jgi:HEAT repeat protein